MGARHSGREAALQMLFQIETSGATAEQAIALFWRHFEGDPEGRDYADAIVRGVHEKLAELDACIVQSSSNWRIERMARVDRNLLRLGAWELQMKADVPRAVILDEAVELAKSFGAEDSGAFVNGVLNQIADRLGRVEDGRKDDSGPKADSESKKEQP